MADVPDNPIYRKQKSANGRGVTAGFSVLFDAADHFEARANAAAQRIASNQHGARKRIIVAVFGAMQEHYERTGRDMTPEQVTAAVISAVSGGGYAVPQYDSGETIPMQPVPTIAVGTAQKASATAQAGNLLKGMGGLFGKKR